MSVFRLRLKLSSVSVPMMENRSPFDDFDSNRYSLGLYLNGDFMVPQPIALGHVGGLELTI